MMRTNLIDLAEKRIEKMSKAVATQDKGTFDVSRLEKLLLTGDLSGMPPEDKINYVRAVCESLGLNPLTQPLAYIRLSGKEVLYAKKDCTEQLRKINNVSIGKLDKQVIEGIYTVTAPASLPSGRTDESTGCVSIKGLSGDNLANAFMKAETKAKRRVTLSICGLGFLDETEIETIPGAQLVPNEMSQPKPITAIKTKQKVLDIDETPEPETIIDTSGSKPMTLERETIYKKLIPIYREFEKKYPELKIKDIMKQKYNLDDTRLMTIEQLESLVNYIANELENTPLLGSAESTVTDDKINPNAVKNSDLPWLKHMKQ